MEKRVDWIKLIGLIFGIIGAIGTIFGLILHFDSEKCINANNQINLIENIFIEQESINCSQYLSTPQVVLNKIYHSEAKKEFIKGDCYKSMKLLKQIDLGNICIKVPIPYIITMDLMLWIFLGIVSIVLIVTFGRDIFNKIK